MLDREFRKFLEERYTKYAVSSRLSKAKKAEEILGYSFDEAVSTEENMYQALITLRLYDELNHAPMQNALRTYYIFVHNCEFPKLSDYENRR